MGFLRRLAGRVRAEPEALVLDLAVAGMCVTALFFGASATWDLSWPCDVDLYRDIGFAQSMLDGRPLSDPLYLGERLWYNPLVPALIALSSWITGLPVHLAATRLGALSNLLAPISFYIMVACLVGRRSGVAATLVFLFVGGIGGIPSWASATYSPWLFTSNFVQGLFYLGVAAYHRAVSQSPGGLRWHLITGGLLGLCFLGHTAPALVLGSVMALHTLRALLRRGQRGQRLRLLGTFGLSLVVALLVSLPYLYTIAIHYGLDVQNPDPSGWIWPRLALRTVQALVQDHLVWIALLPLWGGLGFLLGRGAVRPHSRGLVVYWFLSAGVLFAYYYLWQWTKKQGAAIPVIVPGHHFLVFLKALEALFFGHALVLAAALAARGALAVWPGQQERPRLRVNLERISLVLILHLAFFATFPAYRHSDEFVVEREKALKLNPSEDVMKVFHWVRQHTEPTDVFLADDHYSLHLLSPAGRKVVAMIPFFSNPFVAWKERHKHRHEMFSALIMGRHEAFAELARKYQVKYVMATGAKAMQIFGSSMPVLKKAFSSGSLFVLEVVPLSY